MICYELPWNCQETVSRVRVMDFTAVFHVEKSVSWYNEERVNKISKTIPVSRMLSKQEV